MVQDAVIDFGIGAITGGVGLSACWGWFWFAVGTMGFFRGTCNWRVLVNSLAVGLAPSLLAWAVLWARGAESSSDTAFLAGLSVMPLALTGFGLRRAQNGRRVGSHMLEGIRQLMDELLGKHHACDGCVQDHEPQEAGRSG